MPADTFSALLGTLVMGTGNDNNNWGDLANASIFAILEDALCRRLVLNNTGGTADLSAGAPPAGPSQARHAFLVCNGALGSNLTIVVPNLPKHWIVVNQTSGAFSLLMRTPSGAATEIPQGTEKIVFCDGNNGVYRTDRNEIGLFADFAGPAAPPGYVECDGSVLLIANHPDLFAKIGTTWGGNGITNFALPLLNDSGRFRRSRSGAASVGTYQGHQFGSHQHTGAVTVSGSATTGGQSQSHTHSVTLNDPGHNHNFGQGVNPTVLCNAAGSNATPGAGFSFETLSIANAGTGITVQSVGNASQDHSHSVSMNSGGSFTTDAAGASETRPEAAVVLCCIRY